MRIVTLSGLGGIVLLAGMAVSTPAKAAANSGNYCAVAVANSSAIRGPNYGTAGAQAGCGAYDTAGADTANTATATHRDPVDYTDQEAASASFGADNGGHLTSGQSIARANLNDASLHGFAESTATAGGAASARWSEVLTFTNTTGANQYFTVGWRIEGAAAVFGRPGIDSSGQAVSIFGINTQAQGGISDGYLSYTWINGETNTINGAYNPFGSPANSGRFAQDFRVVDLGGIDRLITSTFGVAPGVQRVDVSGLLNLDARNAYLDFSNTAGLFFDALPGGVTFTSSSGVFSPGRLAAPGAVPEPSSWAMLILGFGLLGAGLRLRSRRTGVGGRRGAA